MRENSQRSRILRRSFIGLIAFVALFPSLGLARPLKLPKHWTMEEIARILTPAKAKREEVSESREEWRRFMLGDENGYIPPDGLARALEQRKGIIREMAAKRIAPDNAALPSTPAGWTNLTGYVHPVGRINDLLIHPTIPNTMWAGTDGGGIWKTTDAGVTWQAANDFLAS